MRLILAAGILAIALSACPGKSAASAGETEVSRTIYFTVNDSQSRIFIDRNERKSRKPFPLKVSIAKDGRDHPARVNFRGNSSFLDCYRKSMMLEFSNREAPALLPGFEGHRYFLMSMCQDRGYVRTHAILSVWQELDLFPFSFRPVELKINNESWGIYMLVEHPVDGIRSKYPGIRSIVRTEFTHNKFSSQREYFTVEFSDTSADIAAGDYVNTFLKVESMPQEERLARFSRHIDLDQHLTMLAVSSILRNGDYIDELWFYDIPGGALPYYRLFSWDPEEVFRACHYGSKNAWEDPNGLAYCVESRLSKAMLENNEIYTRFVDILGNLLQKEMAVDRLIEKLRRSEQVISDLIDSEEVILRMRHFKDDNGQSIGLERSRDLITSQRESLETAVRQRNSYLVKACRKAALSKSCAL